MRLTRGGQGGERIRRCRRRPLTQTLCLEPLEGRWVPSFLTAPGVGAGLGPQAVAVGDFNGDSLPDLAVANAGSNDVSILLNDGQWSPGPRSAPHHHRPTTHAARRADPRDTRSVGVALPASETPGRISAWLADQAPEPPLPARAVDDAPHPTTPAGGRGWHGRAHHHPIDVLFEVLGDSVLALGSEDH